MDLISKELLIKKIRGYIKAFKPNPTVVRLLDWLINIVDGLPVTQIKTGKWLEDKDCIIRCSICGNVALYYKFFKHCPECGSRMVGYDNDN